MTSPDEMKVAVCEYLLQVNRDHDPDGKGHAFIPPTAINWLGDGIVSAILAVQSDARGDGLYLDGNG